ncbi:MAG: hypothetical protein ACR2OV_03160 [Hyphomicrobiaceae bacterium]
MGSRLRGNDDVGVAMPGDRRHVVSGASIVPIGGYRLTAGVSTGRP